MTDIKRIANLAIPATLDNILQTLVSFIDSWMIAKIGLAAVTAVGLANTILNIYQAIFIAFGIAATTLIAQKIGQKSIAEARTYAFQSLVVTTVIGLILGILSLLFGKNLLVLVGASEENLTAAITFFSWVGGGVILLGYTTVLSAMIRATGETKTPLMVGLLVNLLNIVIDAILIFGLGPIPALGILGTAIGTVLSRLIGAILLFQKFQASQVAIQKNDLHPSSYTAMINLAVPATLERFAMRFGQVLYFSLIVAIGEKTLAAHTIAGNIEAFTYMPAYGLAAAVSVLVGMSFGEEITAKPAAIPLCLSG